MKTISVCRECGSPRVYNDAYVNANDPADVSTYDNALCRGCGDDDAWLVEVSVPDNFDIEDDVYTGPEVRQ